MLLFFSIRHALRACLVLAAVACGVASAAEPVLSQLAVEQPIVAGEHVFTVTPKLRISFTLAKPAEPTVTIGRHLAGYYEHKWPWLMQPFPVRTLKPGKLAAGTHTVEWDGLDEKGQPIVEVRNTRPDELATLKLTTATPEQLTTTSPVDRLQVSVEADGQRVWANLERAVGTLRPNRLTLPFYSAMIDRQGRYLVSHFLGGVARYSADWILEKQWPKYRKGQGYDPDECGDVGCDSHGNVFAVTSSGVYRFGADADGDYTPWPVRSDYMRDQPFGHKLGVKTDDPELGKKPGFGREFSGFTVDDKDCIYLGRVRPDPCIMVFDNDGRYLRSLPLPEDRHAGSIRWLGENTLAVTAIGKDPEGILLLLDSATGAVRKRIDENCPLRVWAGTDGTVYAGHGAGDVRRYSRSGDPVPFDAALPYVKGHEIRMYPHEIQWPKEAAGFPRYGKAFAIAADGSFVVSGSTDANDRTTRTEIARYSREGHFIADDVHVDLGQRTVGNVYLDAQPAIFELFVNNLAQSEQLLTLAWTTTDFDGKQTTGTTTVTARPLARQSLDFTIPAPDLGHYRLAVDVRLGERRIERLEAQFARIPSRPIVADRWSNFAMCCVGEFELMAMAGAKSHRCDSASWARTVEPLDGVFYPERPDAVQFQHSGTDSIRARARANGYLILNGLNYGEGWLGGDWQGSPTHHIYSYDRFYGYCLGVLDKFAGKKESFYQFWNEPNCFWNPRGPFGREHFTLVQDHVWSMVKARDKDALAIADGDTGGVEMMEQFAAYGAAERNDTVQMHYPATKVFAWNDMKFPDLPEAKLTDINKLVAIRDRDFPGKPVWNTEEGIPANPLTAENTAMNIPRVYIPQIAAGVDKIYWFSCERDLTGVLDDSGHPFPSYVSYATVSQLIDGAVYAGKMDFDDGGAFGYLFARSKDFVLAIYSISGEHPVSITAGVPSVTVIDLMGRSRTVQTAGGKLAMKATPHMQYVLLPRAAADIAKAELKQRLEALQVKDAAAIPAQVTEACKTALTDRAAMNRLYQLVKAAEIAAAAGAAPKGAAGQAPAARAAIVKREGADGYLRQARIALEWAERLAQFEAKDPTMSWPAMLAAQATQALAAAETPMYPGVAINAFIGEPGEIAKVRSIVPVANKQETSIDDKFRFEIERKAGETFELELTVSNYFRHKIEGKVAPRLPDGWKAEQEPVAYALEPGKTKRLVFTVQIPAGAKSELYRIGGQTSYQGADIQEIHASRVKL